MVKKIKKNKLFWIVGLFVFCFLVAGFVFPESAQAGDWGEWIKEKLGDIAWDYVGLALVKFPMALAMILSWLAEFLFWILFEIAASVVDSLFDASFYKEDLQGFVANPVVQSGWSLIVGFVNLFFVIVLLFIGVGTLLRVEKYNYKKLLIRLVICALLTNFSLLFAGIILDLTHVIMFSDLFGDPIQSLSASIKSMLWDKFTQIPKTILKLIGADDFEEAAGLTSGIVMEAIFVASAAIVILATAFYLLLRVAVLWLLLVLSPFAYISMVLPDTKGIADRWWGAFLKYAFLGPILFFFLWFAAQMTENVIVPIIENVSVLPKEESSVTIQGNPSWINPEIALGDSASIVAQKKKEMTSLWMGLTLITILLWGGLLAASSMSIVAAGAVMGMAKVAFAGMMVFGAGGAVAGALRFGGKRAAARSEKQGLREKLARSKLANMDPESEGYKAQQAKIEKLSASKDSWKTASRRLTVAAAFSPITMGRAAMTHIKARGQQNAIDDGEMLAGIAGRSWSLLTGRTGLAQQNAEEQVIKRRRDGRNVEIGKIKAAGIDIKKVDLEKAINQMKDEIRINLGVDVTDFNAEEAQKKLEEEEAAQKKIAEDPNQSGRARQAAASKLDWIKKGSAKIEAVDSFGRLQEDLSESEDGKYIQAARKSAGFFGTGWKDIATYDKAQDQRVQGALKNMEYKETDELISRFAAADEDEKEAIALKIQANGDMNDLMAANGYASTEHTKFLNENFSEDRAPRLASRMQSIADKNRDYNSTELLEYDPVKGEMTLMKDHDKRQEKIFKKRQKVDARTYLTNLNEDNLVGRNEDGQKVAPFNAEKIYKDLNENRVEAAHLMKPEMTRILSGSLENMKNNKAGWGDVSKDGQKALASFLDHVKVAQKERYTREVDKGDSSNASPDRKIVVSPGTDAKYMGPRSK